MIRILYTKNKQDKIREKFITDSKSYYHPINRRVINHVVFYFFYQLSFQALLWSTCSLGRLGTRVWRVLHLWCWACSWSNDVSFLVWCRTVESWYLICIDRFYWRSSNALVHHGSCVRKKTMVLSLGSFVCQWKKIKRIVHFEGQITSDKNEWMNKWMNKWMNGWMNEWMNEWIGEWMNKWMSEWVNEWMDRRMNE